MPWGYEPDYTEEEKQKHREGQLAEDIDAVILYISIIGIIFAFLKFGA
jgi:hypothetical protein